MALKGFSWLRVIFAALHIVSKETKGSGDDKVAEIGSAAVDIAEAASEEDSNPVE